jgi:hypothetical protein
MTKKKEHIFFLPFYFYRKRRGKTRKYLVFLQSISPKKPHFIDRYLAIWYFFVEIYLQE